MVAQNIILPNIRKFIVPDPGYLIVDADLSGADAQVVAWEADDADLKKAFRAGIKIHFKNARDMFPEETKDMTDKEIKESDNPGGIYYTNKKLVHAINYGGSDKGLGPKVKLPTAKVTNFRYKWLGKHPGILEWHERTHRHLDGVECWRCNYPSIMSGTRCEECNAALGRTVRNKFGYRRIYFDRVQDPMWREALAWIPQSTVAIVTQRGFLACEETYDFFELLLQVHDSIVFQIPKSEESSLEEIRSTLNSIVVPYDDPLYIPWGMKWSDTSWGDCE